MNQFVSAFALIVVALIFALMGAIVIALPLGLVGGFMLIKEMYNKIK